ncbi:hypothetical protein [Saccharopolyspora sp. 6V]|uniref:hypothetical protein n=1 Tax=Saccharopolyspora sp. 6V TaxID=2877239 RepID=UPI001CD5BE27|nr:hypothetical protein [Saccharopolyspora sp. 6V]MCA1191453.1 hypothetical protein [Saccharopolyspora sp. 6V]
MTALEPEPGRHYWRPASDGIRHAFRGRRYNGQAEDRSVCDVSVALEQEISEQGWCMAPTCGTCNGILISERAPVGGVDIDDDE